MVNKTPDDIADSLLPPFQNVGRFSLFRFIIFARMYLDIICLGA